MEWDTLQTREKLLTTYTELLLLKVYFQKILSSKSPDGAQLISCASGIGFIFMALPSVLIAGIAKVGTFLAWFSCMFSLIVHH